MERQNSSEKIMGIIGIVCLAAAACLYILGMVLGRNVVFACGIICAVVGSVLGKKADKDYVKILCAIFAIATSLELFMRVRDGYTGNGWYYFHLLQHPKDNVWNK